MNLSNTKLVWSCSVRWCWLGLFWGLAAVPSFSQSIHPESAGARFGFYPFGAGSHFYQAEAFMNWDLPWAWDLGSDFGLQSRVDASAGWLGASRANAALMTLGPSLLLTRPNLPLSLEVGVSPTVLSHSDFPDKDLGTLFQFTSHAGINWDLNARLRLNYRFQHMSNGGVGRHNPGLNLHMFGVSYLF